MKRKASIIYVAVLLAGLTAGCGGGAGPGGGQSAQSGSAAPSAADSAAPAAVTLSFLRLGNDEAERTFWNEVIAAYEADHPGVKITYDEAAIGDAMDEKLTAEFEAITAPTLSGTGSFP